MPWHCCFLEQIFVVWKKVVGRGRNGGHGDDFGIWENETRQVVEIG